MSNVKKPQGLTVTRSGATIKVSWSKGASYDTMQYAWTYERPNTIVQESAHTTSVSHASKTFSGTVTIIRFGVRGKKGGKWSDWATKSIRTHAPKKPNLKAQFIQTAMTTFTWSAVTDNYDRPITNAIVETILVQDCPSGWDAIASLKAWNDATRYTRSSSGSITPEDGHGEDTGTIAGKSYTRIVRVKMVGIGGESAWAYAKHVYADPYPAKNITGVVKKTDASLNCEMSWKTPANAQHPIDLKGVIPQWTITTPTLDEDMNMDCPSDAGWESLPAQASTSDTEKKIFTLDGSVGYDECLFVRVVTLHDITDVNLGVKSNAVLATGDSVGALTPPVFNGQPSITSGTVSITAENGSSVHGSIFVDYFEYKDGKVETLGLHDVATKVYQISDVSNGRVGLKAFVGTWNSTTKEVENVRMESPMTWSAGNVPVAPTFEDFELEQSTVPNTVNVTWNYSWDDADACEVSWSTEPDAWVSTEDPDEYVVLRGLENKLAIKGVEAGVPLYVRIRYLNGVDEDAIMSPPSEIKSITISTVPAVPTLDLEKTYFVQGEEITCRWIYVTTDGTEQAQARLAERITTTEGGETVVTYTELKRVETEQKTSIANTWETGTQHFIAVQVANGSGNWSEWSEAVAVTIAEPLECHIVDTSLVEVDGVNELQELDLTITVTGAGAGGRTKLIIERSEPYRIDRPEGEDYRGFKGEVVYQDVYNGETQQTITAKKIHLDDTAQYNIHAVVEDAYGQTAIDDVPFTVNWNHKAPLVKATVEVTDVAKITIGTPTGAHTGDYADIYRSSADGMELIYTGAQFGETYVDPYPTIGEYGYLIVGRNAYGDYRMAEAPADSDYGQLAWYPLPATYESDKTLIDFDGERIELYYNVDVSHSWAKDFKKTKYLGGSIVGDYVTGVERTGNISAVNIPIVEEDTFDAMRRLARYEGNCHVRTKDGSSFTACVQVSEDDSHDKAGYMRSFSMTIDKVDPVVLDGMTEDEWEGSNAVE